MTGPKTRVFRSVLALLFLSCVTSISSVSGQTLSEGFLKGMNWRQIGPFRGGRVLAVTGVAGDPNTYYFGAVAGGFWKTTNAGMHWVPLTDKTPIMSVGAIAVAPSDRNVIYVGTGESCIRGDTSYGDGVYKSTDAGKTWSHMELEDTRHIAKVLVDPQNPNIVFVAALGHAYGPNLTRGVFRSDDGGTTWKKVLYRDEHTGAIDLVFDPNNSHILFAALWDSQRTPWSLVSGGPGSGLYKSTDAGNTWKRLEGHGLPEGVLGRIGVSVSGADGNRVYAIIESKKGGIYRSDDAGDSWHLVNADHKFTQRAWYFHHIFADPKSADTLYVLNTSLYRSTDAGTTFTVIRAPHGDHHGLWIDPTNPLWIINSNDGGADITHDGGKSWSSQANQPTAQFYHVATDTRIPYRVYGAQQDNSTVSIASRSDSGDIDRPDWYPVGGGESGYVVPNIADPDVVYAGSYDGLITRYNHKNHQRQDISSWPLNPMGSGAAELRHRFQWTAPIAVSPHDPGVLYHGGEAVFMSKDEGMSWTAISPDLTRNDKSKQQSSGGPITQDNTSVEYYDTVFAIAESPVEKGLIWAGSDDGLIHVTRDAGQHWSNVTPKDLPEWSLISIVDPSPHAAGKAYVAVDRHKLDDFHPYIYKTADFGKSWTKITATLPDNSYIHVVREDPKRKGLLFAGAENGIYVSFDDGSRWQSLKANLPTAPIYDLTVKDNDLVAATHGRSFWILDDITPLRQMTAATTGEDVHLFQPPAAVRFRGGGFRLPPTVPVGSNPPDGVMVSYFLKAAAKEPVTLEISDRRRKVIRKFPPKKTQEAPPPSEESDFLPRVPEKLPSQAGLNRFVWDMRAEPPSVVASAVSWAGQAAGPLVPPGTYQLTLSLGPKNYTASAEIMKDPRVQTSQADLEKQYELATRIRDRVSEGHDAVNGIRDLRAQLALLKKRLEDGAKSQAVLDAADALNKKMEAIEEKIIQPKSTSSEDPLNFPIQTTEQLMALQSTVSSADTAPTAQSFVVFNELSSRLDAELALWRDVEAKDLPALNGLLQGNNIAAIGLAPARPVESPK